MLLAFLTIKYLRLAQLHVHTFIFLSKIKLVFFCLFLTSFSLLSGDECSSEPLEAGSTAGPGSAVSLCHLPALLHPLRADVRP